MYNLELNLSKMTMISLAKAIWKTAEIKNRTNNSAYYTGYKNTISHWNKDVMQFVLDFSDSMSDKLPLKLKRELKEAIVYIGEELYSWNLFLVETLRMDIKFIEETYITSFGSVDELQVFEKYWLKSKALKRKSVKRSNCLLDWFCILGQENLIYDFRYEIVNHMKKFLKHG